MSDSAFDSVKLAEGIRLVLRGLGLILTEMGEYTARVSEPGTPASVPTDVPSTAESEPAEVSTDASTAESEPAPAATAATPTGTPTGTPTVAPAPSVDDITKLIVQKLKENGRLNEKIQGIVKKYDVDTVKDIPEEKRADFVEQLKKL